MRNGWISSINQKQKHMIQIHVKVHIFSVEVIRHVFYKIKIMTRYSDSKPEHWKVLEQQAEKLFQAFAQFKCWIIHQTYLHLGKQIESHFPPKIPTNISTFKHIARNSSSSSRATAHIQNILRLLASQPIYRIKKKGFCVVLNLGEVCLGAVLFKHIPIGRDVCVCVLWKVN